MSDEKLVPICTIKSDEEVLGGGEREKHRRTEYWYDVAADQILVVQTEVFVAWDKPEQSRSTVLHQGRMPRARAPKHVQSKLNEKIDGLPLAASATADSARAAGHGTDEYAGSEPGRR